MKLADINYVISADLYPLINQAENGDLEAQLTLLEAFDEGKGASKSSEVVAYLEQKIFDTSEDTLVKLGILWNRAIRSGHIGEYQIMKVQFNETIDFMQENIPMEEWDFSLFDLMSEFLQQEQPV